jgi:hypothetical protein
MSQQHRQERITETLELLGRLTPAHLPADRDLLFFRAGEASARSEQAGPRVWRFTWPAVAATLSFLGAALGYAVANREPQVQIVHVERPSAIERRVGSAHQSTVKPAIVVESGSVFEYEDSPAASQAPQARYSRVPVAGSDLIHPQDWAALSDAFTQQLRLRQERSEALANVRTTDAERNDQNGAMDKLDKQPRTYLELREAIHSM